MIGHYIEDDALDAFSLMGLINGEGNLAMTTSKSLDDFADWVTPSDVDFVLLDINRPDSRSLEKDVARIRESSSAPIIFITGDEAKYYRKQAILAGGQAVIEKDSLSVQSLQSTLALVVEERGRQEQPDTGDHQLIAPSDIADIQAPDQAETGIAFSYIREVLGGIANLDGDEADLRSAAGLLQEATASLRLFIAPIPAASRQTMPKRPVPVGLRAAQTAALAAAKQRGAQFVFQMGVDAVEGAPNLDRIYQGIRYFLYSAIVGSSQGNTLAFSGVPTPAGMRLTISSHEAFAFNLADANNRQVPTDVAQFNPTVALTVAMMLLEVEQPDITLLSRGSMQTITIEKSWIA